MLSQEKQASQSWGHDLLDQEEGCFSLTHQELVLADVRREIPGQYHGEGFGNPYKYHGYHASLHGGGKGDSKGHGKGGGKGHKGGGKGHGGGHSPMPMIGFGMGL